ncbi:hypothetical protein VNI00_015612 [Paramarasmius palmivorus]|uniref:Uncharacterized protein n=1 Tax=Paramarasmius palmivorus TaxID=297713 RepID=A0AAW0BJ95_9AGAR
MPIRANSNLLRGIGATVGSIYFIILVVMWVCFRRRRAAKRMMSPHPFTVHKDTLIAPTPKPSIVFADDTTQNPIAPINNTESTPIPPRLRKHKDSGWRPAPPRSEADSSGGSNVLDVPPEYEDAL